MFKKYVIKNRYIEAIQYTKENESIIFEMYKDKFKILSEKEIYIYAVYGYPYKFTDEVELKVHLGDFIIRVEDYLIRVLKERDFNRFYELYTE